MHGTWARVRSFRADQQTSPTRMKAALCAGVAAPTDARRPSTAAFSGARLLQGGRCVRAVLCRRGRKRV
jgi:hypothetical protein